VNWTFITAAALERSSGDFVPETLDRHRSFISEPARFRRTDRDLPRRHAAENSAICGGENEQGKRKGV